MRKGSTEQSMAALPRTTLYLDFHQRAPPTQKEVSSPFIELVQKTPSQAQPTPNVVLQAGPTHTFLQDVFRSIFPLVLILILIIYI